MTDQENRSLWAGSSQSDPRNRGGTQDWFVSVGRQKIKCIWRSTWKVFALFNFYTEKQRQTCMSCLSCMYFAYMTDPPEK